MPKSFTITFPDSVALQVRRAAKAVGATAQEVIAFGAILQARTLVDEYGGGITWDEPEVKSTLRLNRRKRTIR